jgi:uncharacterized protein YabN with tetrapyrrole methylase and pyrophosphatase domain
MWSLNLETSILCLLLLRRVRVVFHPKITTDLILMIPILTLNAVCRVPHGDDIGCDVGQVQIESLVSQALLFETHTLTDAIT